MTWDFAFSRWNKKLSFFGYFDTVERYVATKTQWSIVQRVGRCGVFIGLLTHTKGTQGRHQKFRITHCQLFDAIVNSDIFDTKHLFVKVASTNMFLCNIVFMLFANRNGALRTFDSTFAKFSFESTCVKWKVVILIRFEIHPFKISVQSDEIIST